jgi:hypothetical protein
MQSAGRIDTIGANSRRRRLPAPVRPITRRPVASPIAADRRGGRIVTLGRAGMERPRQAKCVNLYFRAGIVLFALRWLRSSDPPFPRFLANARAHRIRPLASSLARPLGVQPLRRVRRGIKFYGHERSRKSWRLSGFWLQLGVLPRGGARQPRGQRAGTTHSVRRSIARRAPPKPPSVKGHGRGPAADRSTLRGRSQSLAGRSHRALDAIVAPGLARRGAAALKRRIQGVGRDRERSNKVEQCPLCPAFRTQPAEFRPESAHGRPRPPTLDRLFGPRAATGAGRPQPHGQRADRRRDRRVVWTVISRGAEARIRQG